MMSLVALTNCLKHINLHEAWKKIPWNLVRTVGVKLKYKFETRAVLSSTYV
jgi:hypothetical protein